MENSAEGILQPISLGVLSVPVDLRFLHPILAYSTVIFKTLEIPDSEGKRLELAIEEAFANSIQHFSRTPDKEERIHVDFQCEGEQSIVISIRDRGIPFEIDDVSNYAMEYGLNADMPGLGLHLIFNCVDKVESISGGHNGKEIRLTKYLPDSIKLPESLKYSPVTQRKARKTVENPVIRLATREDLPTIRRLAWHCYGYSYVSAFYDLEQLAEMMDSGCYVPAIALDPDTGEAIYHVALELDTPKSLVAEEGMAFADPNIHAPGVTQDTTIFLNKKVVHNRLRGLYMNMVTNHVLSQRATIKHLKTVPCAIFFSRLSRSIAPIGLRVSTLRNVTTITHYHTLDRTSATIFIPQRHEDMIRQIYNWMDLPREFKSSSETVPREASKVEYCYDKEMNFSIISVHHSGADSMEQIKAHMNEQRKKGVGGILVHLPMNAPDSPSLVEKCEEIGLSFVGVIPLYLDGQDAIILQWVGVPLNMDSIKIYGDEGRLLFEYVKSCLGY